jgi:cobalamin-dependent methionine synthase I
MILAKAAAAVILAGGTSPSVTDWTIAVATSVAAVGTVSGLIFLGIQARRVGQQTSAIGRQTEAEAKARREERRWATLNDAELHLRLSSQRAWEMRNLNLESDEWAVKVAPFVEEAIRSAAALATLREFLDPTALDGLNKTVDRLFKPDLHDGDYMAVASQRYWESAQAVLTQIQTAKRRLARS